MIPTGSRPTLPPSVLPDISPIRGEIETSSTASPISNAEEEATAIAAGLISPLVGEMSGRTEGGNVGRKLRPVFDIAVLRGEGERP
jgi:hypothetical protein